MNDSAPVIRADFDQIALISQDDWNHNKHYHGFLLKYVPESCKTALDIGCGTGAFSRLLANHSDQVVALDLSPRMIEIAQAHSRSCSNIDYQVADVTERVLPEGTFDFVASIATMHHLPITEILVKIKKALRSDGTLAILDLYESIGWRDRVSGVAAVPVSLLLRLVETGRLREPQRIRDAWAAHGRHDTYPTLEEVRHICRKILPGAQVRKHLLWRYSIIWKKVA